MTEWRNAMPLRRNATFLADTLIFVKDGEAVYISLTKATKIGFYARGNNLLSPLMPARLGKGRSPFGVKGLVPCGVRGWPRNAFKGAK